MDDCAVAPNNPAFFGSNISLSAVTNITLPSVQAFSAVTYQGRQVFYSAVWGPQGEPNGAYECPGLLDGGLCPRDNQAEEYEKILGKTGKRHFTLDKWRTAGWLLVKAEPIEGQGTNSVRLSFQAAPGLWASSAGSREGCGFLSPRCRVAHVASSLLLLSLLWAHTYLISGSKSSVTMYLTLSKAVALLVKYSSPWFSYEHVYSFVQSGRERTTQK